MKTIAGDKRQSHPSASQARGEDDGKTMQEQVRPRVRAGREDRDVVVNRRSGDWRPAVRRCLRQGPRFQRRQRQDAGAWRSRSGRHVERGDSVDRRRRRHDGCTAPALQRPGCRDLGGHRIHLLNDELAASGLSVRARNLFIVRYCLQFRSSIHGSCPSRNNATGLIAASRFDPSRMSQTRCLSRLLPLTQLLQSFEIWIID